MTSKTATTSKKPEANAGKPSLIVFGVSDIGKPRAGTFLAKDQILAAKAAATMGLSVLAIKDDKCRTIAARLPRGRVSANARSFVPFVKEALFGDLLIVAGEHGIRLNNSQKSATSGAPAKSVSMPLPPRLPKGWEDISVGDLVLATDEDPADGRWKAIVVKKVGDMLSLQWQTRLSRSVFVRHKFNVALLCGGFLAENPDEKSTPGVKYPSHPSAIGVGQTVCAPEEGPQLQFWDATVIEAGPDNLVLRWLGYDHVPPIRRTRKDLALICPEPGAPSAKKSAT